MLPHKSIPIPLKLCLQEEDKTFSNWVLLSLLWGMFFIKGNNGPAVGLTFQWKRLKLIMNEGQKYIKREYVSNILSKPWIACRIFDYHTSL